MSSMPGTASQTSASARRPGCAIVDAILSGTHEPGSSHYLLLRAFMDDDTLTEADAALDALGYRTHEFGDSVLIERSDRMARETAGSCDRREACVTAAA